MVDDLADEITAAERHVAEAREIIAEQVVSLQRSRGLGADTRGAERRLRLFQSNLMVFEEYLEWLMERQRSS